jgi:hypothetical protein
MTVIDTTLARSQFTRLALEFGREWTVFEYAPTGPNDGYCWDRAYATSMAGNYAYVEGVVFKYDSFSIAHGWSLRTSLIGETVLESTEGYDTAATYRGFVIDLANPHIRKMTDIMADGPRSSIIETALGAGVPFEKIRSLLKGEYR